jgi:N-methylhydantoinase B
MTSEPDVFTVEVVRQALTSIAEEMSLVVMRSARSPLLRDAGDHSSALVAADGGIIAQGRDLPIHLGVMAFSVRETIRRIGVERLAPGDIWYVNLPESGGNHLPDVKAIRPIFHGGELVAFALSLAHYGDIGGATPGSYTPWATDIWQEGFRIPPTRVFAEDRPVDDTLDLILANVRSHDVIRGDLLAQAAATRVADRRLKALLAVHGADTFRAVVARLNDLTENQVRETIRSLPRGVYDGAYALDDRHPDGRHVTIRVRVTIEDDSAVFDFSETDDAVEAPVNGTPYVAAAAVCFFVKAIAAREVFHTDGVFRAVRIVTRPGSLLQPPPTYPVVLGNHETSNRCVDAIMRAMATCVPDRVTAGGCATAAVLIFSGQRADGRWWTFYETHGGGEGAHADRDGLSVTRCLLSNMPNTPAEIVEGEYPILVRTQAIRDGSGGAGRHVGGDGMRRVYEVVGDNVGFTAMLDQCVVAPYGLEGGSDGLPFSLTLVAADGTRKPLETRGYRRLVRGDQVILETCGGGGFGSPA